MTPEAQQIAIAQACGLHNYPGDLNAMHEAEKVLFAKCDWRLIRAYFLYLSPNLHGDDAHDDDDWKLCHATAAQRAEAFLKILNLWEESV